ncbi:MAG TPA: hypothetical protein VM820_10640 [Vicinamibacterales bacterium]|nr:hypothetical protein [Vicinamibacterales bacterium]
MIDPRPRDRRLAWVALGFTALTLVFTWPLALGLSRDVPGDLGDSLLNMWILAWGAEHAPRLLTGTITWAAFWNGNIFHPEPYSLAFSEHMFAQALQIAPIYALTGNIILGYNLLFLSTFVISAIGAYLLARDLTGDWRAGIIAGLVFGFLPYRISQVPHLQVLSSEWMPLALWGFHRYIAFRSTRGLIGGTIALVLQNWSCGYYLLYFAPFVPLFVLQQLWSAGRLGDRRAWVSLAAAALATIGLTLPFLLPYLEVQRLYAFERPFGEVLAFSANVWSYATAAEPIHLWGHLLRYHPHGEGETFLGVTAPILALVAMAGAVADGRAAAATVPPLPTWRRRLTQLLIVLLVVQAVAWLSTVLVGGFSVRVAGLSIRASTPVRLLMQSLIPFFVLALVSPRWRTGVSRTAAQPITAIVALLIIAVWLSLGPAPSAGPYRVSGFGLYDALYRYVPGFTGVRVPARYAMIAGLFLALAAAFGASRILRRSWGPLIVAAVAVFIVADGAAMPLMMNHTWATNEATPPARVYPRAAAPRIYADVRALPADAVVAEFPFGDPAWEIRAVYYAAVHGKRVLNGYSGAFPPGYRRRLAAIRRFEVDSQMAWDALVGAGTTHVVVHTPAFGNPDESRALLAWLNAHGVRRVTSYAEGDALYELPREGQRQK